MKASPFLFVGFVVLAACQTYDFEPVNVFTATVVTAETEITASRLPPHIMILLDKSGSMNKLLKGRDEKNVDGTPNANCTQTNCDDLGFCDESCSTRINELRYAMMDFLEGSLKTSDGDSRPLGKFGLTLFPTSKNECAAPESVDIKFAETEDNAALAGKIREIQTAISNLHNKFNPPNRPINGGTPTGNSLKYLLNNVSELKLNDEYRDNFILLLTDGLPNCNDRHSGQSDCPDQSENICRCTLQHLDNQCVSKAACGSLGIPGLGCLDTSVTVSVIEALRNEGIRTIVIGFGVDEAIDSEAVLNAMARAGGLSDTYYPAEDRASLLGVLQGLRGLFEENPCVFKLSGQVSDPSLISVYVDDKRVTPGGDTYFYDKDNNSIVFVEDGALCERLKNSSNRNPVPLRIAVLRTL
jgi:hypothetical protein